MAATTTSPAPDALKADSVWSRFNVHKVPPGRIVVTAFASYIIVGLCWLGGAPEYVAFPASLLPWIPIAFFEVEWTYKHFGWFALFLVMAIVQTLHYSEHIIEVIQYHIFNTPAKDSLALFSRLNVEGVHFAGDSFLTFGTLALIYKFPRNPWLWVALPFQIIHQAEHTFLFWEHVVDNYPAGGAGLFAKGGAVVGDWGLIRPDLHFIYNTLYTIPFVIALVYQLKRTYDEALDEAFPEAPKTELIEAAKHLETFKYQPGETVCAEGDLAHRVYVITDGEANVIDNEGDQEVVIDTLTHGKVFGEHGVLVPGAVHDKTVRAKTALTVLAMDEPTLQHLMNASVTPKASSPSTAPAPTPAPAS